MYTIAKELVQIPRREYRNKWTSVSRLIARNDMVGLNLLGAEKSSHRDKRNTIKEMGITKYLALEEKCGTRVGRACK